jgi:DNA-binding response OmpR family regulator
MRLKGLGHELIALRDGAQMLDLLKKGDVSLIILDLGTPFIHGFELIASARKERPELPVLAMSAQNFSNIEIIARNTGADRFIPKPFEFQEFFGIVDKLLLRGRPGSKMAV